MQDKTESRMLKLLKPFANKGVFLQFIAFWVASSALYLVGLAALVDVVPPSLMWVRDITIHISIILGFIASVISAYKNQGATPTLGTIAQDGVITIVGAVLLIVLYIITLAVSPTEYVTTEEFRDNLSVMGLSDTQVVQVDNLISERLTSGDYISQQTLELILNQQGLNEIQVAQLVSILEKSGYIKRDEIPAVVRNEIAIIATETKIAEMTSCRVKPLPNYASVSIRSLPRANEANQKSFLSAGGEVIVVGHNNGEVNIDKWWLVDYGHGGSKDNLGWVASWVVVEINETECIRVKVAPGY